DARRWLADGLIQLTVDGVEGGAQRIIPSYELVNSPPEGHLVRRPEDAPAHEQVIGGRRGHRRRDVRAPEALLSIRRPHPREVRRHRAERRVAQQVDDFRFEVAELSNELRRYDTRRCTVPHAITFQP